MALDLAITRDATSRHARPRRLKKPVDLPMGFWRALVFFSRHYPYLAFDLVRYRARLPFRRWRDQRNWRRLAETYRKVDPAPPWAEPLLLAGRISEDTGIGRAVRYEVERIKAEHKDVQVVDTMISDANAIAANIARGALRRPRTVLLFGQPDVYDQLLPLFPSGFLAFARRVGLWVWEMDQFPPQWRFALDIVHEIWTPSTFCANAFRKGTDLPIKVVPHAVTIPDVPAFPRAMFGVRDEDFLGLAIMDLRWYSDRKNPLAHVRAWKLAFGDDPTKVLLIKARFGKRTYYVRDIMLAEIGDATNIRIVERHFSNDEITRFQKMADVYISLHRAEGFALNIAELIGMGKPVVGTGWSGLDLRARLKIDVPYELVEYLDCRNTYIGSLIWAEPNISSAAYLIVSLISSKAPE